MPIKLLLLIGLIEALSSCECKSFQKNVPDYYGYNDYNGLNKESSSSYDYNPHNNRNKAPIKRNSQWKSVAKADLEPPFRVRQQTNYMDYDYGAGLAPAAAVTNSKDYSYNPDYGFTDFGSKEKKFAPKKHKKKSRRTEGKKNKSGEKQKKLKKKPNKCQDDDDCGILDQIMNGLTGDDSAKSNETKSSEEKAKESSISDISGKGPGFMKGTHPYARVMSRLDQLQGLYKLMKMMMKEMNKVNKGGGTSTPTSTPTSTLTLTSSATSTAK